MGGWDYNMKKDNIDVRKIKRVKRKERVRKIRIQRQYTKDLQDTVEQHQKNMRLLTDRLNNLLDDTNVPFMKQLEYYGDEVTDVLNDIPFKWITRDDGEITKDSNKKLEYNASDILLNSFDEGDGKDLLKDFLKKFSDKYGINTLNNVMEKSMRSGIYKEHWFGYNVKVMYDFILRLLQVITHEDYPTADKKNAKMSEEQTELMKLIEKAQIQEYENI